MHQCSERFVLPDRDVNGPEPSLSESACGMTWGCTTRLWDNAYNAFSAYSNGVDFFWTMRQWIRRLHSDHFENPAVCGCGIKLHIPTEVGESAIVLAIEDDSCVKHCLWHMFGSTHGSTCVCGAFVLVHAVRMCDLCQAVQFSVVPCHRDQQPTAVGMVCAEHGMVQV